MKEKLLSVYDYGLLGCHAGQFADRKQHFTKMCCLHLHGKQLFCDECNIPGDHNLNVHCCHNLTSHTMTVFCDESVFPYSD